MKGVTHHHDTNCSDQLVGSMVFDETLIAVCVDYDAVLRWEQQ